MSWAQCRLSVALTGSFEEMGESSSTAPRQCFPALISENLCSLHELGEAWAISRTCSITWARTSVV